MRCKGWRVLVTGASKGIGKATARLFAEEGADLILCARNENRLNNLASQLKTQYAVATYVLAVDLCDPQAVDRVLTALPANWQAIDVLVNNAGLALGLEKLQQGNIEQWGKMIDTNIKGVLYVSRYVIAMMLARNKGHIINIGSISAYQVYSGGAVYCATKFAIRAITEGIKMDVHGTPIRTTQVDPGMVGETDFSITRFSGDREKAAAVYEGFTPLKPEDVADAVVYAATRPPHVDVRNIAIMPTDQTASHLCYRKLRETDE